MSTHCSRYPKCGCSSYVGTKCQLDESDIRLTQKEPEFSKEVEEYKLSVLNEHERRERGSSSINPKRKHATNYTKPKNRKKK